MAEPDGPRMTQLHPRKKIELVVERARLPEMLDLLHEAGSAVTRCYRPWRGWGTGASAGTI